LITAIIKLPGDSLPGGGKNVVGSVRGEGGAIRMSEHRAIATYVLVTAEVHPGSNSGKLDIEWAAGLRAEIA
jgi:hypothetical protein